MWRLRLSGALWLMLWWVADHAGLSDGWMLELRCSIGTDRLPRFLFREPRDCPLLSRQPCTVRLRIVRRRRLCREQADQSSIPATRP